MNEPVDLSRIWPQLSLIISTVMAAGVARSLSGRLLRWFESGVVEAMRAGSSPPSKKPPPEPGPTPPPRVTTELSTGAPGSELLHRILAARLWYGGALLTAVGCGIVAAGIGWSLFAEIPRRPAGWILWTHPYLLLLIPCALAPLAWNRALAIIAGVGLALSFCGLLIWLDGHPYAVGLFGYTVVPPVAVVALVLSRRTLAASTLLFFPTFLLVAIGIGLGYPRLASPEALGAPPERFARWDLPILAAAVTVAGSAVLVVVAHARKWISDRMMRLDAWWLVGGVMIAFVLASASGEAPTPSPGSPRPARSR